MKKIIYGKNKNIISTNLKIYRYEKEVIPKPTCRKNADHECEHGSTND